MSQLNETGISFGYQDLHRELLHSVTNDILISNEANISTLAVNKWLSTACINVNLYFNPTLTQQKWISPSLVGETKTSMWYQLYM